MMHLYVNEVQAYIETEEVNNYKNIWISTIYRYVVFAPFMS